MGDTHMQHGDVANLIYFLKKGKKAKNGYHSSYILAFRTK
jgi:hypothetical protein